MGKIVVKAQQQNVYNIDGMGNTGKAYVLRPVRYSTMRQNDIVEYCMKNSLVPKAYISSAVVAFTQCIENFLLNGHSVELPGLGIFYLTSNGITTTETDKCGLNQVECLKVRFTPCPALKAAVSEVEMVLDGVYDIAGETVLEVDEDGKPIKTRKYYKKVVSGDGDSIELPDDPTNPDDVGNPENPGNQGGGDLEG